MPSPQLPPDPETIRRTAAEILQGSDFRIDQDTRVGDTIVDIMTQIIKWIVLPFRWLFDAMDGLPNGVWWLIVIVLAILLAILVGHILYTLLTTLSPSVRKSKLSSAFSSKKPLTADQFEQLAHEAFAQNEYIVAVRFLFRASLVHLQSLEGRLFSPGLTNRHYLRRYRNSPFVKSLQSFVDIIDTAWYGNGVCREAEYLKCREAYAEIKRQTKEVVHADNA